MTAIQHFSDLVNYFYQTNTDLSPFIDKLQSKNFANFDIEFKKPNNTLLRPKTTPQITFSFENENCVKKIDGEIVFQLSVNDAISTLLEYLPIYNQVTEAEKSDITSEIFAWLIIVFAFVYFLGSYLIR